jgi:pilus assembly protein CpaF
MDVEAELDSPVALLESEVRELIRRRGVDPARDHEDLRQLVDAAITDYDERSLLGAVDPLPDRAAAAKDVIDAVAGLGPLQRYLDDPSVEEVWINEPLRAFLLVIA